MKPDAMTVLSSAVGQLPKGGDNLRWPVWLCQKPAAFRQIAFQLQRKNKGPPIGSERCFL